MRTSRANASIDTPRHACNTMNTAPADHACGRHATGYAIGGSPARRANPQWSSGMRMPKCEDARNISSSQCAAPSLLP
jgi:hypothetical protein